MDARVWAGALDADLTREVWRIAPLPTSSRAAVRPGRRRSRRDVFHTNSIQCVHTPPYGMAGGDLLVNRPDLDTIALIDGKREEVVWAWGRRVLDKQHHPTLLPFGNVLMFDNGMSRGWSRVIEVDPISEQIVWEYRSPGFFSAGRGSSQRLRNGNVLVTESGKGGCSRSREMATSSGSFSIPSSTRPAGSALRSTECSASGRASSVERPQGAEFESAGWRGVHGSWLRLGPRP